MMARVRRGIESLNPMLGLESNAVIRVRDEVWVAALRRAENFGRRDGWKSEVTRVAKVKLGVEWVCWMSMRRSRPVVCAWMNESLKVRRVP